MGMVSAPPRAFTVNDPAFKQEVHGDICVFLDGVTQQRVVAYDCDAGTVTALKFDEQGRLVVDWADGEIEVEVKHGRVAVEWANPARSE